ncbi:hypothetical protein [Xylanibacillus composti]|uniref:Uncharacterized protein n=1 Tax=Xylanibacillus composti TaxID=1572762 RepID=A0A8J4H4N3_9BACL|nr:hypothetical protein [Xylanibacillus composti]GIQ69536.1 hypothetical protein XYCOK13_23600 [Xylanibacillus composti]
MNVNKQIPPGVPILTLFIVIALLAGCANNEAASTGIAADASGKVIRIGYQKYGTMLILKSQETLEEQLKGSGYRVTWIEFPGGRKCWKR